MPLINRIDRIIESSKWVATAAILALSPLVLYAIGVWILRFGQYPLYSLMFGAGVALVVALCRTQIVSSHFVRNLIHWERKVTQWVFSLLTLLPLSKLLRQRSPAASANNNPSPTPIPHSTPPPADPFALNAPADASTRDHWLRKGNWVMLSSPYWLPTASILLWLASGFLLPAPLRSFVIGFGVAYHVASVLFQWHYGTSELRRLGQRFVTLFLIPANLLVIGTGYAFALDGFSGLIQFSHDVFEPVLIAYRWLRSSLM
jgi:hypothetical protein